MKVFNYEIRQCENCGLRYPLIEGHPYGKRCPVCLGDTRVALNRSLPPEPEQGSAPPSRSLPRKTEHYLEALLDNVRSAWNVGAIFRTADGFGIKKLYLCGISPTPENGTVRKTSLGAEKTVAWEYSRNGLDTAKKLKMEGYSLIALEQDERAVSLFDFQAVNSNSRSSVLVIGNEVTGVDPELLDLCDQIIHIPMRGQKRSFNVEVAFAIAAYALSSHEN